MIFCIVGFPNMILLKIRFWYDLFRNKKMFENILIVYEIAKITRLSYSIINYHQLLCKLIQNEYYKNLNSWTKYSVPIWAASETDQIIQNPDVHQKQTSTRFLWAVPLCYQVTFLTYRPLMCHHSITMTVWEHDARGFITQQALCRHVEEGKGGPHVVHLWFSL